RSYTVVANCRRLWQHRPSFLKPVHCRISCGDKHAGETIANVVTSLPFIILGMQTPSLQDELKHGALCEFASRSRDSFKLVPFLQGRNQKTPAVGRLYYDSHHYIVFIKSTSE
ncbi:Os09g0411500, partial [Oryza sativa Japonica Group]